MMYSEKQLQFGRDKSEKLPTQCKECQYLFACNGECPKNRFCKTASGETGLNYLCKGYYQYFDHVAPYMDFMKKRIISSASTCQYHGSYQKRHIITKAERLIIH